jgi:signal transduction histidine kinase
VHGARGLRFERIDGDDAVFAGGREDLEEMLGNLLDNAGKWAEARVRVQVAADAGRVLIAVRDDGPGLPPEARDQVTGRGVRLDEQTPGSGLGLAIVQDIAGGYGGQLRLADAAPGLVATLELPAG